MDAKKILADNVAKAAKLGKPMPVRLELTHDLAARLLIMNSTNRPLRPGRALRYREDMAAGKWAENGETLKIGIKGHLVDGQHRCEAVVGTDLRVPMLAVFGVSETAGQTVDQGAPRNAGDYLAMRGEPNAPLAARIVRLRLAYDRNDREALRDISKPTNAQVLEYFDTHHDEVLESAKLADELREFAQPLVTPAVLGFAHNVLRDIDPAEASAYIEQVAKGEAINEGDAAWAVRNRLLKMGRAGAARKVEPVLTGWNAFHSKRPLKTVRVTGKLPALAA
jgi:hypothetical protein